MYRTFHFASLFAVAGVVAAHADVVISNDPTSNMTCSGGVCSPSASDAVLNVTDLENMLASGSVEVTTTGAGVQANNIDITDGFSWSSANGPTLDAYQSITFTAPVTDGGTGSVSLVTNDGGMNGVLLFAPGQGTLDFARTKTSLLINGVRYRLAKSVKELSVDIAKTPRGNFALSSNVDARKDGLYYNPPIPLPFGGAFNGLGHNIVNLTIADTADHEVGLFARVRKSGSIANVSLIKAIVRGGNGIIGGLVGENDGTIIGAFVSGVVHGEEAGEIIGDNEGSIALSQSGGAIYSNEIGGGLVGYNDGSLTLSFAAGKVTAGARAGGLVGVNAKVIANCYASGAINGSHDSALVGGFLGYNYDGTVESSYSTGVPGAKKSGALVGGFDGENAAAIKDSYWDTDTSGADQGSGDGNEAGLTGLTTAEFQSGLPAGFDPAIWAESPNINGGLPYLINNPPPK